MLIGVSRELKPQEFQVGPSPESAAELTHRGHGVLVESGAGAGIADDAYRAAGADIVGQAAEVFAAAERPGQVSFTFESSRPTTHAQPTFVKQGIVHYFVSNMPGAVPHTSTYARNNATLPHVLTLADKGWRQAPRDHPYLRDGLNVCAGHVTHPAGGGGPGLPRRLGRRPAGGPLTTDLAHSRRGTRIPAN